ncbi:hypothetical protein COLAER_01043 [Collinsella aerofaciens ATCC 25986]|uniref:Uncharacterized protein n=1 Tax=Collinsella aerofaciens (strain ATCC 25986 / DSM 3979 / JCM 10188 / KCTC 3647 / NCTC 11838 / VPI 1003) TaxID=411903 RepID=A4E9E4_COLAA|nr:hypothetical protein COLAER_01043 [Collinsella aerofaciens ATCC 25986]
MNPFIFGTHQWSQRDLIDGAPRTIIDPLDTSNGSISIAEKNPAPI